MRLTQPLHKAAREKPFEIATVFGERSTTFLTHKTRVSQLAGALKHLGLETEDRVAILAFNSDYYIESIYATFWAGGVINPVNTRWSQHEIIYSLNDCQTKFLIVDDNFAKLIEPIREQCPSIQTVIYCGEAAAPADSHAYNALIEQADPVEDAHRADADLAAILYTGGTTGQPKGVMLSHEAMAINALAVLSVGRPPVEATMHVAPLFHVGGLASLFQGALRLAKQVILPGFDPIATFEMIEREKVNETFLVPTMIQFLLDHPDFSKYDLSSMRNIIYGAASIDETLLHRAIHAIPSSQFMQVYGMTEIAPVVAILPNFCHTIEGQKLKKLKAAGRPTPINEVKIINPETGQESEVGEFGEIVVRGPSVMLGYWNKPEETKKALIDGWMHTGDGGYMDEDGDLDIPDRLKDMIVSGGENVYSTEVENALLAHPAIRLCAVIGVPDPQWGEAVHAVLVLRDDHAPLTLKEVRDFCRTHIAGYKCPRSIEFRTEMPLSAAGKLLKYKLRESYTPTTA